MVRPSARMFVSLLLLSHALNTENNMILEISSDVKIVIPTSSNLLLFTLMSSKPVLLIYTIYTPRTTITHTTHLLMKWSSSLSSISNSLCSTPQTSSNLRYSTSNSLLNSCSTSAGSKYPLQSVSNSRHNLMKRTQDVVSDSV